MGNENCLDPRQLRYNVRHLCVLCAQWILSMFECMCNKPRCFHDHIRVEVARSDFEEGLDFSSEKAQIRQDYRALIYQIGPANNT